MGHLRLGFFAGVVVFSVPGANGQDTSWMLPLETLNRRLPSSIQFNGEYRDRFEAPDGIGYKHTHDRYLLSRLRLGLTIRPASWLRFVALAQDSRVFLNNYYRNIPPYQNTWDIREAYVQVGNKEQGFADAEVGRQILLFGDQRLIGPSDWLNMGRTFDAVRVNVHQPGFVVSLFASSVILARDGVIDHHYEGNNLYGAYASFTKLVPKAIVEPYVLWRVAPARLRLPENAGRGALDEVTTGFRLTGRLPGRFDYNIEMAKQTGSLGPDSINSWAGHWEVSRAFADVPWKPRLSFESNYASGTKDPSSRSWGTFDQIYPSAHDKLDFADQVGWRNIKQVRAGVEERPTKKWKLRETYESFWLASTRDGLYATNGSQSVAPLKTGSRPSHVGQEVDLVAEYTWIRADTLGFGYGRLFSGPFLKRATSGKDYNYPFVYLGFRF